MVDQTPAYPNMTIPKEDVLIGTNIFGEGLRYSTDSGYSWNDADPMELALRGELGVLEALAEATEAGPLPLKLLQVALAKQNDDERLVTWRG